MKVCFIQASNGLDLDTSAPLWPGYLKSFAERFVDADWRVLRAPFEVLREKPDVLAISAMSQDWEEAKRLIRVGCSVGARVIVGGHHVTAVRDRGGPGYETVIGPGEAAFASLLTGDVIEQPQNLDLLPMPDRLIGHRGIYRPILITSRGCAFKCSFCSPKLMWDGIRFHSPRRVVDEVKSIKRDFSGLRTLAIWDDLFAAKPKRVRQIRDLLAEEMVKMKFTTGMRAELVTDESCRVWKSMGLTRLGIGGESASQVILDQLKGGSASVEKNQRAIDIMHGHGMKVGSGVIFGTPGETEADIIKTYEWLLNNYKLGKLMSHSVNILTPLPGTAVWDTAVESGHVSGDGFDWGRLQHISMGGRGREWMALRRRDKSIYLNEGSVPQEDLYQMIDYYEGKISTCSPSQIVRSTKRRAEQWLRSVGL